MVRYTATDAAGNVGSATLRVVVIDTTQPVRRAKAAPPPNTCTPSPSLLPPAHFPTRRFRWLTWPVSGQTITGVSVSPTTVEAGSTPSFSIAVTATDNLDQPNQLTHSNNAASLNALPATVPASFVLQMEVRDRHGNVAAANRTLAITDTTKPAFPSSARNPITLEAGAPVRPQLPSVTAVDLYLASLTDDAATAIVLLPTVTPVTFLLTYTACDTSGNCATASRNVTSQDTQAPTLALVGAAAVSLEGGQAFVDPGVTNVVDSLDTALGRNVAASLETTVALTRLNEGPQYPANGFACPLDSASSFAPPPARVPHPFASAHPDTVSSHAPKGSQYTPYAVRDLAGNRANVTRVVTIEDSRTPTLRLLAGRPANDVLEFDNVGPAVYQDGGVTAVDDLDGDLSAFVCVGVGRFAPRVAGLNSDGDFSTAGRTPQAFGLRLGDVVSSAEVGTLFAITYSSRDGAGNEGSTTRHVKVVDTRPPVVALLGPELQRVPFGTVYRELGGTAQDLHDGETAVTVAGVDAIDVHVPGESLVRYSSQDRNGNAAVEVTRRVVVEANDPPSDPGLVVVLNLKALTALSPRAVEAAIRGQLRTNDFVIAFALQNISQSSVDGDARRRRQGALVDQVEFGVRNQTDLAFLAASGVAAALGSDLAGLGTALGGEVLALFAKDNLSPRNSSDGGGGGGDGGQTVIVGWLGPIVASVVFLALVLVVVRRRNRGRAVAGAATVSHSPTLASELAMYDTPALRLSGPIVASLYSCTLDADDWDTSLYNLTQAPDGAWFCGGGVAARKGGLTWANSGLFT